MLRMKIRTTALPPMMKTNFPSSAAVAGGVVGDSGKQEWEMRPGGMLVQKRNPDTDRTSGQPPTIRVRVKYVSVYHEISISSQATFGELKKRLTESTGLHHEDQKLIYKDKERDSKAFLDITGVKDRSKVVLIEDVISREKRLFEMRKNAKFEKASKSISEISLEVDKLGIQVSALEKISCNGKKVEEKDVLNLIELLMNQLLKLDEITADGDVKLKRKLQVKRVQNYVETLDTLKMKNSMATNNGGQAPVRNQQRPKLETIHEQHPPKCSNGQTPRTPNQEQLPLHSVDNNSSIHYHYHPPNQQQQQQQKHSSSGPVVVTTKWELFD